MPAESMLVRNSERALFLRCRQAHHWGYTEKLKPKVEAPALRFGTLIHKSLEARYPKGTKRGPHPTKIFKKLYATELKKAMDFGFRDGDGKWESARDIGIAMLNGYVDLYGTDDKYEVIATEQTFRYPIKHKGKTLAIFVGTFDGVWKNITNGRLLIKDYKTTGQDPTRNPHLILDEQATTYMTFGAAALVSAGMLPRFPDYMLYTFMKKGLPPDEDRPQNKAGQYLNKDGSVSKNQPTALFHRELIYRDDHTRKMFKERVVRQVLQMKERNVYKSPGYFTCIGCAYADMCEMHESGADLEDYRRSAFTTWDPYDAHELLEEQ